jgi:acyl-CoA thioesterase YciA
MDQNPDNLVLRTVAGPADINANGHIFGGWILSQMDIAGGIAAGRRACKPVATVAINGMTFLNPMLLGDVISIYATIEKVGRTSITVKLLVDAARRRGTSNLRITEGLFTFVAIGADGRPTPVDG